MENFGLTEVAMPIMTPYGEPRPASAAGWLVDEYFDVRLVDPNTDQEVPVGEVGELVVRARLPWTMCTGYFGMPEKTAEAQRNLWSHTGDGLRRDDDGWYYFVDRLKDALRRHGENISSFEVEQPLLALPGVAECAVVGVPPTPRRARTSCSPSSSRSPKQRSWRRTSGHGGEARACVAVPRYIRFVDELPLTPSGKVRKGALREAGTGDAVDRDRNAR